MSEDHVHDWKQEYYGIRCSICDLFYPDNSNWFAPDDDDDEEEEDYDPKREFEREQEELSRCWCGAFQFSAKQGRYVQYADCVCGVA